MLTPFLDCALCSFDCCFVPANSYPYQHARQSYMPQIIRERFLVPDTHNEHGPNVEEERVSHLNRLDQASIASVAGGSSRPFNSSIFPAKLMYARTPLRKSSVARAPQLINADTLALCSHCRFCSLERASVNALFKLARGPTKSVFPMFVFASLMASASSVSCHYEMRSCALDTNIGELSVLRLPTLPLRPKLQPAKRNQFSHIFAKWQCNVADL